MWFSKEEANLHEKINNLVVIGAQDKKEIELLREENKFLRKLLEILIGGKVEVSPSGVKVSGYSSKG